MDKIFKLFENVKGGPMSTFIGLIMFGFGGWSVWVTYNSENAIAWASVEVGIFIIGCYLLFKTDEWIRDMMNKKKEND